MDDNRSVSRQLGDPYSRSGSPPNSGNLNVIRRAVVIEHLVDLSIYSDADILGIYNNISNRVLIDKSTRFTFDPNDQTTSIERIRQIIPKNSILCKITTDGAGRKNEIFLAKPMFSSHLMMPVKAGEQVFIFQEKPRDDFSTLFWMCRIPSDGYVEDANYTHLDREFLMTPEPDEIPQFNNGFSEYYKIGNSPEEFNTIDANSLTNKMHRISSVPRLTKRPGDLVLQGSNNTAIILGDDRGWTVSDRPDNEISNSSKRIPAPINNGIDQGTIDIVAGRGRFGETSAEPILNVRNKNENNKYNVQKTEGDPDFVTDSSRVYVSMNTSGDDNFGLTSQYPSVNGTPTSPVDESPYVIIKSDEVRIVARKDSENDVNGSVKIVKEGDADSDRAVIMIQPDGTIMIDGPKIVIGSGINNQIEIGDGAQEPSVLGDQLVNILSQIIENVITVNLAISSGIPDPTAAVALPALQAELNSILSSVSKVK
jgi:hypothetical protein